MPEYKNIWFADTSEPMLVEDISYKQAVSVGDELEKLKYNTSIICTSAAQVAEAYPNPVQGDRVYRADLGVEQMYFGSYNSSLNPYGKNSPGWYAVSSGLVPIYPTGYGADVSTVSVNSLGKISFTGAKTINLPNVFTSEFRNYKAVVNVHVTSAGTPINMRYISGGVTDSTSNYLRSLIASETATVNPPPGVSGLTNSLGMQDSSIFRNIIAEQTFIGPYAGVYPKMIGSTSTGALTSNNRFQFHSTIYNSASKVMNGITLYTNGTATMDGSIQVYGYR